MRCVYLSRMAPNSKQLAMRRALEDGFLNEDSSTRADFAASVLAAGYSRISLLTRSTRYRRWLAEARVERGIRNRELAKAQRAATPATKIVATEQWSPLSGKKFLGFLTGSPSENKPDPKPEEKPAPRFEPETVFEHPQFGICTRSANGGLLPAWARQEVGSFEVNLSSLPTPGTDPQRARAWERMRAEQDRFARSYQTNRDTPPPPPIYTVEEEERKPRGYKDAGVDVAGDAAAGKFGFGRVTMKGE